MALTDKTVRNGAQKTVVLDTDVLYIIDPTKAIGTRDCYILGSDLKIALGIYPNTVLTCTNNATTTIVLGTVLAFHGCTIDCVFTRGTARMRKQLIEVSNLGGHVIFAPGGYTTYPESTDETLETTGITLNARLLSGSIVFEITVDNSDANDVSLNYKYLNYH